MARRLQGCLDPYDAGRYFNFVEQTFDITKIFPPDVLVRLREVKQRYDPDNLFHSNHGHGLGKCASTG